MVQTLLNKVKKDENLKYIFKGGSISFIFKMLGVLLGFLVIWIISKFYNEKYYGTFALLQVIVQLLVLVFTFGFQNVLVIEINKNEGNKPFETYFLFKILKKIFLIGLIPSLVLFLGASLISDIIFLKPNLSLGLKIMGIGLPFFLLHEISLYFFIARKEFLKFGIFMFVLPNVLFIIFILFFKEYIHNENHIFLYYTFSFLLCFLIEAIIIFPKKLSIIPIALNWKDLFSQANPIMFSSVTFYLLNWVSVIMLGRYESESQIGIYNAAYKIGLSVQLFMLTINIIISPRVANLYHNKKLDELREFIHHSTRLIAIISLPVALVILIFSKNLLGIFGSEFINGSTVLSIITISTFINAASGNVDQILYMTDNQKKFLNIIIISLIINIIANFIFIPLHGITGAAIANFISTLIMNILALTVIKKKLGYYTLW